MKPINFPESNVTFAKNQPPYLPLPAYQDEEQGGRIFHCWQLSIRERIKVLITGKLWINVWTDKNCFQKHKLFSVVISNCLFFNQSILALIHSCG